MFANQLLASRPLVHKGEWLSSQYTCELWSAVIGFLDRNYRYKSVATQVPHDAGWEPILYK